MPISDVARALGAAVPGSAVDLPVTGVSTDSRTVRPGDLFVAIAGPRCDGHDFTQDAASKGAAACVVASDRWGHAHGIRSGGGAVVPCLRVKDTIAALGKLAAYYRREVMSKDTRVIAVTGSNGKTTTKQMIDHLLSADRPGRASPASYNNHIGVPLTLLSSEGKDRYLIVEIGTSAPGEVATLGRMASPDLAVITSIGEAHLEGFDTLEAIVEEKTSLLNHVRAGGLSIVNVDRLELRQCLAAFAPARLITFGCHAAADCRVVPLRVGFAQSTFVLAGEYRLTLKMPGAHHAANAAAAWLVGRSFDMVPRCLIERLASFVPGAGRARVVEAGGVTLVDDAYNANPASMMAVVETLSAQPKRRRVLVMGDMLELGRHSASSHERVLRAAVESGIELVVTVGQRMTSAGIALSGCTGATSLMTCTSAEALGGVLAPRLERGDCVWVKGSRAMGLDRAVRDLETRLRQDHGSLGCGENKESSCADNETVRTSVRTCGTIDRCAPR